MHFVSPAFFAFLPIVFFTWRILPDAWGVRFLCLANFVFYGYWYPPFLFLLIGFGLLDYLLARCIPGSSRPAVFVCVSVCANLAALAYFKYTNFFFGIANQVLLALSIIHGFGKTDVILPIGISFYVFQSIGYVLDVHAKRIPPSRSLSDFFLYLCFFPHLVAGPILRAHQFFPQLHKKQSLGVEDVSFFLHRFTRGFFLKAVIADNIAPFVDDLFFASRHLSTMEAWTAAALFAVQICADFGGYSDIAIGTARLFGIRIPDNFRDPYAAVGLQDFWRRWHVSLSTWFRDYVYVPLGGNRRGCAKTGRNIGVTFLLSGLWHGANWTFLSWGAMHGAAVLVEKGMSGVGLRMPPRRWARALAWVLTLLVVVALWVPFRAPTLGEAFAIWKAMLCPVSGRMPALGAFFYIMLFVGHSAMTYIARSRWTRDEGLPPQVVAVAVALYCACSLTMAGSGTDFIYFQF